MPNVSFDIFFDKDFINITATRGVTAPKAKPEWKVRTAPKLPPKPVEEDHSGRAKPPPREKLTSLRQPAQHQKKETDGDSTKENAPQTEQKEKKKPAKLGPKKAATNGA